MTSGGNKIKEKDERIFQVLKAVKSTDPTKFAANVSSKTG
jgi:hypothetical protein